MVTWADLAWQFVAWLAGTGLAGAVMSYFVDRRLEKFRDELVKGQKVHELQLTTEFSAYKEIHGDMVLLLALITQVCDAKEKLLDSSSTFTTVFMEECLAELKKRRSEFCGMVERYAPFIDSVIYRDITTVITGVEKFCLMVEPGLLTKTPFGPDVQATICDCFPAMDRVRARMRERVGLGANGPI